MTTRTLALLIALMLAAISTNTPAQNETPPPTTTPAPAAALPDGYDADPTPGCRALERCLELYRGAETLRIRATTERAAPMSERFTYYIGVGKNQQDTAELVARAPLEWAVRSELGGVSCDGPTLRMNAPSGFGEAQISEGDLKVWGHRTDFLFPGMLLNSFDDIGINDLPYNSAFRMVIDRESTAQHALLDSLCLIGSRVAPFRGKPAVWTVGHFESTPIRRPKPRALFIFDTETGELLLVATESAIVGEKHPDVPWDGGSVITFETEFNPKINAKTLRVPAKQRAWSP